MIIILNLIFINDSKDLDRTYKDETRSIFISYIELSKYINNNDVINSKKNIKKMINNTEKLGLNTIILQVRSMSDAIYKSNIYPCCSYICGSEDNKLNFDILKYFIKESKKKNIKVIAWINPYRVRSATSNVPITSNNPVYKYIGTDVLYEKNGIYLNPAKNESIDLIVEGVSEIVKNYDVDGILFDDYFYPDLEVDINNYSEYQKENKDKDINSYRLDNVSRMVEKVHKTCKKYNKTFGVSPDGNMENNYNRHFADVKKWGSSNKYVDYLMPQIYYGFYNETKSFNNVIHEWDDIIKCDDVKLMIALAFYKVGSIDKYANSGSEEWILNNDIIKREIILSRNLKHYQGFSLFRYDYLFNSELKTTTTVKEIENIKEILN